MSKETKNLIVGLDIGTSKIVSIVAELTPEGRLEILGIGSHQESRGLKKGVVVNIEATVNAISRVIQEVELMADCKVKEVYTGIAGSHIRSFNSNGMVAIKDKEVSPMDVERVIETARAMPIPSDQQILHILTQEFIVDGQDGVREPIGMSGVRLEVKTHIVTGAVSAAQNIVKCVRRCGLEVVDLVLQPLASSYAVCCRRREGTRRLPGRHRRRHHRHRGLHPGRHPPHGGDPDRRRPDHQRHRDALRTPTTEAEEIKLQYGVALHQWPTTTSCSKCPASASAVRAASRARRWPTSSSRA
jgi:cell division protein FtsA